ncbi:MAG: hypothetical protein NY202_04625 [Mollicutes bacterium UO1]
MGQKQPTPPPTTNDRPSQPKNNLTFPLFLMVGGSLIVIILLVHRKRSQKK